MRRRLAVGISRQAAFRVQQHPAASTLSSCLHRSKAQETTPCPAFTRPRLSSSVPHPQTPATYRAMSTTAASSSSTAPNPTAGPLERSIHSKILNSLNPTKLVIANDSHKHAHHAAMATVATPVTERETHFRVEIVSEAFQGQRQPARHRAVYALCKEELGMEGGVHALQISARTPEEEEKRLGAAAS